MLDTLFESGNPPNGHVSRSPPHGKIIWLMINYCPSFTPLEGKKILRRKKDKTKMLPILGPAVSYDNRMTWVIARLHFLRYRLDHRIG